MEKISITIDLAKIDRNRINTRTYTNSQGQEVTVKEYKLDVVPMRPENYKTIASGSTWAMIKKYFVADSPTKEEREAKAKTNFLGEGVVFADMSDTTTNADVPFN